MASIASGLLIGNYETRKAAKKQRDDYNAAQVDRLANVNTTVAPRELVLGRVRKGGAIFFRGTAGYYKETFIAHIALAGHEIDGVEQIYLNDEPVSLDSDGNVLNAPYLQTSRETLGGDMTEGQTTLTLSQDPIDGSVSATAVGPFGDDGSPFQPSVAVAFTVVGRTLTLASPVPAGRTVKVGYQYIDNHPKARIRWELGDPNAVADARTRALFPDLWTENHRAQGVAKLICEFTYDETAFPNGLPTVTALIRGAKVYDPRTATTAWTDNPALLARHVYTHPFFGKASVSSAEDARFIAAANACDTTHPFVVSGGTDTQKIYRAGLVVQYGTPAKAALDDLCMAMAGRWALSGGELYISAGVYTAPVMTFTDDDLAVVQRSGSSESQDAISIAPHRERNEKFNVVNPRIWDAGQDYKMVEITPVRSDALIARDGEELSNDVAMAAVFFAPQAQHIAGVLMRDARDPLTVVAPFKLSAYQVDLFDTVALTLARYGWTAKTFTVLARVWERDKGIVRLTLKETSAAIYTPDATFLPQGYAQNTALPKPWQLEPPPSLSVSSGAGELARMADGTIMTRVRVSWAAIPDLSIAQGGRVEVQWSGDGSAWQTIDADGFATQTYIVGPADGQVIYVRARTRNNVAVSDWSVQVSHVVVGKTAAPSDVASFAVDLDGIATWTTVSDLDVRSGGGYRLRWQPGTNRSWGDASPLHDGLITESPYAIVVRPAGAATIMIKAVDSSGNESANATAAVVNLGDPVVENVVTSRDYRAEGFPGTIVNASVSGGNLVADADPSPLAWDANPDTAGWTLDTDAGWTAITYKPITYTLDPLIVAAADDGAQLTLANSIAGTAFLITYRRDGDYPGWTSDSEPGWNDDAALAWVTEDYRPWPGTVTARQGRYEFQITTQSRDVQSVISALAAQLDVPDLFENVGQVSIAPGGTVIPATKPFRAVTGIGLTLLSDGGTAVNARVESTATRTVTTRDASDVSVAGKVLATLQGY